MNGRVYDPLLARFGTPDPTTENPFSTQGWNRYSYVGNSPTNFTDPTGYCFMGCFWKPVFKAIGQFFQKNFAAIIQVAATALLCVGPTAPICAGVIAFAVTDVTSGNLGLALRAGVTAAFTAAAMDAVATATLGQGHPMPEFMSPAHLANMAGHALVGCASAVMAGAKCGPGALAAGVGALAAPILGKAFPNPRSDTGDLFGGTAASAVVGGLASVAGGGKFANGAVTAAFGYLFNAAAARCGQGRCSLLGFLAGSAGGAYFAAGAEAVTVGANTPLIPVEVGVGALGGTILGGILDILGWEVPNILNARPPDNAWDPNGPKAPGYPGDPETGHPDYVDPKRGPNWVPNPNGPGYGWEDASGDVWVPTRWGGAAHGGPHWDVQTPGGGYRNVRPPQQ